MAFQGRDLYFADGTSFTESMGVLIGRENGAGAGRFSTLNVNRNLKNELRRIEQWSKS